MYIPTLYDSQIASTKEAKAKYWADKLLFSLSRGGNFSFSTLIFWKVRII